MTTGKDQASIGSPQRAAVYMGLHLSVVLVNRYALWVMHTVKAIYPGTFDPLTNGHLDLIARGAKIVDQLVVAILRNAEKGEPLFSVPERYDMIAEAVAPFANVSVATFDGLLVDFARRAGRESAVLRGIRAISDYEYEFQMAMMNRKLDAGAGDAIHDAGGEVHLRQLTPHQGRLPAGRRHQRTGAGAGDGAAAEQV